MYSIIYHDRVIAVEYLLPIVGDKYNGFTIVDVNYHAKAVWVE